MLKLNKWDKGTLISGAMVLSSLVLRPFISRLVFDSKFFIVSTNAAGDVRPRSRLGGLGFGGKKSPGSSSVGLMVLEMDSPMLVKNELNSSAI